MPPESTRTRPGRARVKSQPTVLIFDSKAQHARKRAPIAKKSRPCPSSFAFIISQDDKLNDDDRRLVKTHAMQHVLEKKQRSAITIDTLSDYHALENEPLEHTFTPGSTPSNESSTSSPQAPPSNLIIFPIETQPYMLRLIHNCA